MDDLTIEKPIEKESKKHPRLIMLLNCWGGICLNVILQTSGLSKKIFDSVSNFDPAILGLVAAVFTIAIVIAGYYLSSLLVRKIDLIAFSSKIKSTIKISLPFMYFIIAIILVTIIAPILSKPVQEQTLTSDSDHKIAPIIIGTTIQDSQGLTESQFNQADADGLKNLENWMVTQLIEKGRASFASTGNDPSQFNPDVVPESEFVNVGDKRLAIIRITEYPSQTNHQIAIKVVRIIGFTKRGLETIGCYRNSNDDIPIWTGECGKKIKEIFGVEMIQQ